jgi:hypothetical protein
LTPSCFAADTKRRASAGNSIVVRIADGDNDQVGNIDVFHFSPAGRSSENEPVDLAPEVSTKRLRVVGNHSSGPERSEPLYQFHDRRSIGRQRFAGRIGGQSQVKEGEFVRF